MLSYEISFFWLSNVFGQKLETNHLMYEYLFKELTSPNMYSSSTPTKDQTYQHVSKGLCYLSMVSHLVLYQCVCYFLFLMIATFTNAMLDLDSDSHEDYSVY